MCGTDREIAAFSHGGPPGGSAYLVVGHESLAEVVDTGTEVTGVEPGALAVLMVRRPCPHASCVACRTGRPDFCYTGDYTERGIVGAHGFMTEFVVDDERYVAPLPASLRDVGVLIEPLTIAEKAIAEAIGARYLSSRDHGAQSVERVAGRFDVIYEATGASTLAFEMLSLMDANAVFVFTGVPGRKASVEVDTGRLMRDLVLGNRVVLGTVNAGRAAFVDAVADLEAFRRRWPEAVSGLITGRFPPGRFADLAAGRRRSSDAIKDVIDVQAGGAS